MPISDDLQKIILTALISGLVGPALILILSKLLTKPVDEATLAERKLDMTATSQKIAAQAIADLAVAKRQITDMDSRILLLEKAQRGPYRLTVDMTIGPEPVIHNHTLELLDAQHPGQGV